MKRKLSAVLPPDAFKDKVVVPFSKAHFDAETVLRPAAMLADRRSVVWVTLDPVGVVMRERDDSRTQGVDNARYDDGGPPLHLALPCRKSRRRNYADGTPAACSTVHDQSSSRATCPPESKSDSLARFGRSGVTPTYQLRAKSIPRAEKRP
jgi:hypothetical protein